MLKYSPSTTLTSLTGFLSFSSEAESLGEAGPPEEEDAAGGSLFLAVMLVI